MLPTLLDALHRFVDDPKQDVGRQGDPGFNIDAFLVLAHFIAWKDEPLVIADWSILAPVLGISEEEALERCRAAWRNLMQDCPELKDIWGEVDA